MKDDKNIGITFVDRDFHTIDDLTTPQIAMADMQALAALIKRMYRYIVDEVHFSFPIFLDTALSEMYALTEIMDAYNMMVGKEGSQVALEDVLGNDIAAAFKYYEDVGEYDVDAEEEKERWYNHLQKFRFSGNPWIVPNEPRRIYYCQEDLESFWMSILDEYIPDEPGW